MPRIRLEGMTKPTSHRYWEADRTAVLGRSNVAQIVLRDDSVSRRHAEIEWRDPNWVLRDLSSTNGTFRNGQAVGQGGETLYLYDLIQVGRYQLMVTRLEPERPQRTMIRNSGRADPIVHLVRGLTQMAETGPHHIRGHGERVAEYALMLAKHLGLPETDCVFLEAGAPLHDLGMIGFETALANRATLTTAEWAMIRAHPIRGVDMVDHVPELAPLRPIIRSHHERWDGKGYPDGLKGEAIPLLARIVGLADAFDAMTSEHSYRPRLTVGNAFAEVACGSGTQFDPRCVSAFLPLRPRIQRLLEQRDSICSKTLRVELEELAYSDHLTGLPNRPFFEMALRHAMATAAERRHQLAILFADLDGFKQVNDRWGHQAGDRVLGVVARRLKGCVRQGDIVARLGGDEFALVLGGLARRQDAVALARKIVRTLAQPCVIEEGRASLTISVGVSFFPDDATEPEDLVRMADLAMYQAKKHGKNHSLTCRAARRLANRDIL